MRNARFDLRFYRLFALLAGLVAIVGALAVGVNRQLILRHETMLAHALPVADISSRLQASADMTEALTDGIHQARNAAELARAATAAEAALAQLLAQYAELARVLGTGQDLPGRIGLQDHLAGMRQAAGRTLALAEERRASAGALARSGDALSGLMGAQTDLARLRVTATIADLHAAPDAAALDRLADDAFFAFERTEELARSVELLRITAAQIAAAPDLEAVSGGQGRMAALLAEAGPRVDYLPTAPARAALRTGLAEYHGPDLVTTSRDHIRAQIALDDSLIRFRAQVAAMQSATHQLITTAQQDNLSRIAALASRSQQMFGMLLAAVVLALAGIGLVFLYARRRLLERMQAVTSRLVAVASGDTGAPLRITGQDEIGRMEKALNVLRVRTIQALHLRAELESAIQTRTRELVDEMQAADDANRRKSEFLARMGHEIRTPLNGMIGMMELISGQPGADRQRLETALTSARDLLQITNDVLSFAASDAGGGAVAATDFRLRDLIGQVHAPLAALAAKKGLEVAVDLAESAPPFLLGDVVKIRQVLGNLTSNAVKYTAQGRVSLLIDHAAGPGGLHVISFTVADTGIGMTPEQAARVFDDFSRAEWARRSGIEGAGLGLAIARRLTEAMGGGLSVETAPGVGSRFTLTVPLHLGDPARITPAESEDQIARFCATVLVVEDHPVNRMVARGFLERLGCRVIEAETAAAALAEPGGFDLALVDLDLPDQPGQQVIAHLRQTCPRLPVAALTAHLLADDAATRAGLNVDAVLTKPVSPRALAEFLGRSLPPAGTAATDHPRIEEQTQDAGRAAVLAVLRADTEAIGRATVQALITAFLDDLPGAVEDVITGDAVARRRAAHRLKGAASNFGLAGLCDLLARAEAAPAELDPARLRASAASAETALRDAARAAGLTLTS